ncbi:unnamed protein product [Calypogeia fissa]
MAPPPLGSSRRTILQAFFGSPAVQPLIVASWLDGVSVPFFIEWCEFSPHTLGGVSLSAMAARLPMSCRGRGNSEGGHGTWDSGPWSLCLAQTGNPQVPISSEDKLAVERFEGEEWLTAARLS